MPSVEALEDSVRIKNENDVEAAAEELARLSGVSLDMAPVVQLTRLSSPIIMAANQCVSIPCLDDSASTSSRKSGKKGVSKKDLKRVDELLKSTLDALVSIKHEPEVHVEQETPSSYGQSDNEDHANIENNHGDDFHHNENDSDNEDENATTTISEGDKALCEEIKIKQEVEEGAEENPNKIGFGLKLKIKKEHGQLNSSIIEQQKSTEKRGEKRKKKKKHKDKEKDKQKLSKDIQDEHLSQDSNANNNVEEATIRIKTEPQDGSAIEEMPTVALPQIRPQPEATIMTSIPMMQFQIACVSSGVEFSNINTQQTPSSNENEVEPEDVKPNRAELDRMMKISNISGGVTMETNETESQPMDHDGNGAGEGSNEDDHHDFDNDSDQHENDEGEDEGMNETEETDADKATENDEPNSEKVVNKKIIKSKTKASLKSKEKSIIITMPSKSRNKACKSTAKPANLPLLQISSVEGGVALESSTTNSTADESNFIPIYIKPEPQNRGYSDEQPLNTLDFEQARHDQPETLQTHNTEEQSYISSIDFNSVVIKQEKDIEINDVQITKKSLKSYADFNGIKRKRKQICRSHIDKDGSNAIREKNDLENCSGNMDEDDGFEETDGEDEEDEDDVDETDEVEEDDEEEDDEEDDEDNHEDEDEEEREYRELEYPPQITDKITEAEEKENDQETDQEGKRRDDKNMEIEGEVSKLNSNTVDNLNTSTQLTSSSNEEPALIISSVCSQVVADIPNNPDQSKDLIYHDNASLTPTTINTNFTKPSNDDENTQRFCPNVVANHSEQESANIAAAKTHQTLPTREFHGNINSDEMSFEINNSDQLSNVLDFTQESKKIDNSSQLTVQSAQIPQESEKPTENSQTHDQLVPKGMHHHYHGIDSQLEQSSDNNVDFPGQISYSTNNVTEQLNELQHNQQVNQTCQGSLSYSTQGSENATANILYSQQNAENATEHELNSQHLFPTVSQDDSHHTPQDKHNAQSDFESTERNAADDPREPVFKISSVTSAALTDLNHSVSNNGGKQIIKDNQDGVVVSIEGHIHEAKHINLDAQPIIEIAQNEKCQNEDIEDDEENESNIEEDENTEDQNLEERQNYQNQEVLSQIRPAALALHPYLEDISSSSNSLLSNSLSQTPPPPTSNQPTTSNAAAVSVELLNIRQDVQLQQDLNKEETENILNESNDILSRRSTEHAAAASMSTTELQSLPSHSHLVQEQPPIVPTFNFDNINEIAENNNNANIEREQLQDEQQQQASNNVT